MRQEIQIYEIHRRSNCVHHCTPSHARASSHTPDHAPHMQSTVTPPSDMPDSGVPRLPCKWPGADICRHDGSVAHVRTGKRQVVCTSCSSAFVNVSTGVCFECGSHQKKLTTILVCRECRSKAVKLPCIQQISDDFECPLTVVDGCEHSGLAIRLTGCKEGHECCLECFIATCANRISKNNLYWSQRACRFSVRCFGSIGMTACPAVVGTPSLLELVGKRLFTKYTKFATERLTKRLLGTVCPFPSCSEAIMDLPPMNLKKMVKCPYCSGIFCQKCKIYI